MPIIKQLYIQPPFPTRDLANPSILTMYRSKALDCITCVGIAVGSSLFKNDARDILEVMYKEGMGEIETESSDMKIYMMTVYSISCYMIILRLGVVCVQLLKKILFLI